MRNKYEIVGALSKYILFFVSAFLITNSVIAQSTVINGKVVDEQKEGIPGVTVVVKGTSIGTVTNFDGLYTLSFDAKSGDVLVFSFVGFKPQEIEVRDQKEINVTMEAETELLKDVVIVGFGSQKKETVVGSVVQVAGRDLLKAGPVTTVSEALAGMLPGVSTMQATGQPGATDATILIRGQSSWNSNQPLFMVDGVERSFNDIDPNEIESISVLKDASATAVFGVKAANGVILITTKRGEIGKTQVNFSSNWGIKVPVMETDYMEDYATAMKYYNVAAINEGKYDALVPQSELDAWSDPDRDMDFFSYTNWIKEMIKTGKVQSYNINVSGGNKVVKYFTSLGYNYDGDIFNIQKQADYDPRTSQKRYNWRSNLDFDFTKSTKLKVNLSGDFKDWHGNPLTANWNRVSNSNSPDGNNTTNNHYLAGMFSAVQVGPPPILSDGRLGVGNRYTEWLTSNYLADLERQGEVTKRSIRIYSDIIFEQKITNCLNFKGKLSYNFNRGYVSRITMDPLYYQTDWRTKQINLAGNKPDKVEALPRITPESLDEYNNSLYYELSLDFNKTFAEDHNVSALVLFSRRNSQNKVQFPSYEESWVGRATYNYKLKYMFEVNGAYNGSEKFAPGKRFGFFPSVALGWTISEEPFFKDNVAFIDFLKLRYSWGEIGSDFGAARFTYISDYGVRYASETGMFGYGAPFSPIDVIYFEGTPANLNATWETAVKQNLGLEMNMFANRLHTVIDLFNEYRTGILMTRRAIPSWYGNKAPDANMGETKNHGFDIDTRWSDKINNNWSYYVTANLSMSENRIIERDDPQYTPDYQKEAGKPIGWNRGYYMTGYLNSWDDVSNYTQPGGATRIPGDNIYIDYNADGVLDDKDIVPILNPSYASNSFAFGFGIVYKQWSLSALFNGAFGLAKRLSDSYLWEYGTTGGDREFRMLKTEMQNYWTPENSSPEHPALHTTTNAYNDWSSTYSIRASDYIRLKSMELKYTFKKESLYRLKVIEGLELYANGNNLITWSKLPDMFDPEASRLEVYPISKRFTLGLRARF